MSRLILAALIVHLSGSVARAQWIELPSVSVTQGSSELAGPQVVLSYSLPEVGISEETPAYVFVRYSPDQGATWRLLPAEFLRGDGFDIVRSAGPKKIVLWGAAQAVVSDAEQAEFRVRALTMARVPGGEFKMLTVPGGGYDESKADKAPSAVPLFYMAQYETTISMYMDGEEDGFAHTSPVGSFPHDKSPYGIFDMAGNLAEWTVDWYTTSWHLGADGYRVVRGGSWAALPEGVDAIAQPTMVPIKASSIIGFRGIKGGGP